jgi:hypothetical protein
MGAKMKNYLTTSILLLFSIPAASGLAASPTISGSIGYEYTNQPGQSKDSIPYATINLNCDLTKTLSFHSGFESSRTNSLPPSNTLNYADLELKNQTMNYTIGRPIYSPGNGFIASVSGLNSLKTTFQNKYMSVTGFYSDDGQKTLATDLNYINFAGHKNLMVDYAFVTAVNSFAGLTISATIAKSATLCIETSNDLNTQKAGYQITTSYGETKLPGDAVVSLSYRNIQPGSVSKYCTDSNYNDSKGFRITTTYKMNAKCTLTAYQDFTRAQNNSHKDESVITLSQNY